MTTPCKVCLKDLPPSEYYLSGKTKGKRYRYKTCKKCTNKNIRDNYDPKKKKNFHLKYNYGITLDEYESKLEKQGGGCAICGIQIPGGNGRHFYVDHNHATGQVRDLLCHNCNFVIGYAKEDIAILEAVINYLQIWGDES